MKPVAPTGSVLVYTLILVAISFIMALAILALAGILSSNAELQEITRKLSNNVLSKGNLSVKYSNIVNSNGSGFIDVLGCPTNVVMSGSALSTTSSNLGYQSGSIVCRGMHVGNEYTIFISTGSLTNTTAEYLGDTVGITGGVGNRVFSDPGSTLIDYSGSFPLSPDGYDDDFNSDDYSVGSTGSTMYPDGYIDDDGASRSLLYGYANPTFGFTNMMWTNSEVSSYISTNSNNTDGINEVIGSMTSSGIVYLDINQDHRLKLYVLDKLTYDATKELFPTVSYQSLDQLGDVGYLQENSGVLSLSTSKTGNEFLFDFTNNDYALFVRNNSTGSLLYTLSVETDTGTGVYINPINDSDDSVLKVLANDVIIDNEGRFLYEQFEVIGLKE